jgi:hypothetical protein
VASKGRAEISTEKRHWISVFVANVPSDRGALIANTQDHPQQQSAALCEYTCLFGHQEASTLEQTGMAARSILPSSSEAQRSRMAASTEVKSRLAPFYQKQ